MTDFDDDSTIDDHDPAETCHHGTPFDEDCEDCIDEEDDEDLLDDEEDEDVDD